MSDETLMILVVAGMLLAFALGIWIGLGYPGLYDKYERTGKAARRSPLGSLVDRLTGRVGRRPTPPSRRSRDRRKFLPGRNEHDRSG